MQNSTIWSPWTPAHQMAAQCEGWDLFSVGDEIQVQRMDDPIELMAIAPEAKHLSSDLDAFIIFWEGKGDHHEVARSIVRDHSAKEWNHILGSYAAHRAIQPTV